MIIFILLGSNMASIDKISNISFGNTFTSKVSAAGKRIYDAIPNFKAVSSEKFLEKIENFGKKCTSDKQRLILGATAIVMQPVIDAHNKNVDEKTREVSVARTIAKIIAGTLTGVAIRWGCIKAMDMKIFKPSNFSKVTKDAFDQYKNAMGTIVALVVMMFTNFLIDAPLTKWLTNIMIDKDGTGGDRK